MRQRMGGIQTSFLEQLGVSDCYKENSQLLIIDTTEKYKYIYKVTNV